MCELRGAPKRERPKKKNDCEIEKSTGSSEKSENEKLKKKIDNSRIQPDTRHLPDNVHPVRWIVLLIPVSFSLLSELEPQAPV